MNRVSSIVLRAALASLVAGLAHAAPATPSDLLGLGSAHARLRLGAEGLPQQLRLERLAPGVTYYKIQRGKAAPTESWYLLGDVARDQASREKLKACFSRLGVQAYTTEFRIPGANQPAYTIVSGGSYASRALASTAAQSDSGCRLHPRHSSGDAASRSGPWSIHLLAVAPDQASGRWLASAAGQGPLLRAPTSQLARTAGALFAVNGGFFVEKSSDGIPGAPAGISVLEGRVNGSPVERRPALVLRKDAAKPVEIVKNFSWRSYLSWSDGARTPIDGINRKPGLVRNCGRSADEAAIHDFTCKYQDDVVYYPAGSAFAPALRAEIQYAIGADGRVRKLAASEAPAATDALLALSPGASRHAQIEDAIARHATASFKVDSSVLADGGKHVSVINAGPTLLQHGEYVRDDAQEGWAIDAVDEPAHTLLMHDWINRRNPRTALGIRKDGVIVLAVVDGHRHATSVGATIEELRELMASLGAVDAVNLDGGGSTAMVVRNRLVNQPSDLEGERKIGDALLFIKQH